jgi:hypothetical protein
MPKQYLMPLQQLEDSGLVISPIQAEYSCANAYS